MNNRTYVHGLGHVPGGDWLLLPHLSLLLLLLSSLVWHGLEVGVVLVLLSHTQEVEGGVGADVLVVRAAVIGDGASDCKDKGLIRYL